MIFFTICKCSLIILPPPRPIYSILLNFSRPGTLAVAGANDGSLLFFDLERESRPCINKLLGHSDSVVALGFSHDETLLASSDQKNQMIIWRKS